MVVGTVETTFLVLMSVIVLGPIVSERFNVPGIVGLIAGGMVVGPFVLDWVAAGSLVDELGSIGILYLMFLAGVSFDLRAFEQNRRSALTYGLLGFILPFGLSVGVVLAVADPGLLGAALIGAMWASNTLVAYPEVQAAGLQSNRAVSAAVSAGVVADLLSLMVLGIATATAVIESEPLEGPFGAELADLVAGGEIEPSTPDPTLSLWLGLPLLVWFCLWLLPRVAQWFFVHVGRSRTQRFVFSLAGMAGGATVALLGGLEGLIGAFLAGLGLNRLVPTQSQLMERLEFVGTSVFVPTFLVSIGLSIDPALLIDLDTIVVGLIFTGFVVVGKALAALITGAVFGLSLDEVGLMSSLSFGQAASTLAIAQVGLGLGMFDQVVVNASVLAIVATALISSYGTRFVVRRVPAPSTERAPLGQRVLLDVRGNGSDLDELVTIATELARGDDGVVVPYAVADAESLASARAEVDRVVEVVSAHGLDADGLVRVDDSFGAGTINLVQEHDVTMVALSWGGPAFPADYLFGNDIDSVGARSSVPTMAIRVRRPWKRVVVVTGATDVGWQRDDAELALVVARRLRLDETMPLVVAAHTVTDVDELVDPEEGARAVVTSGEDRPVLELLGDDDLVVAAAHVLHDLSPLAERRAARRMRDMNVVVVGGPHRLTFSKGVTRRPSTGAMRPT